MLFDKLSDEYLAHPQAMRHKTPTLPFDSQTLVGLVDGTQLWL
jgi:hypothetical protein